MCIPVNEYPVFADTVSDTVLEQSADCRLFKSVVQLVKSGFSNKALIEQTQNLL